MMQRKGVLWLYVFLFLAMIDMTLLIQGFFKLRIFTKPLLMLPLLFYFLYTTKLIKGSLLRKCVAAALVFASIGDTLLLFPNLFLYGMGAFFMTHCCYIIAFKLTQNHSFNPLQVNFVKMFLYNLPIYIGAAFVYFLIHTNLQDLKIPVIIYLLAIVMMATLARERYGRTDPSSFWQVFIGAILFLISDAILALDMFFKPYPEAGILIMGTYLVAQLLILMGIRSHLITMKK
ncbi:lysoplasmalogenase [Pleomorphovibrio marinus]|uniref:lysoplasmalogenase n=1 Tax=Pleomorphovibrio marinus TaxID=2164132 RepID=UPI002937015E|nr:lysoplasmalogenase [Pleomorphovibrio marinus]